ncbi:hypothetical protein PRZ48_010577 [Zasmidium cellare]|uniref:Uncharacterized protein n=1 Tax=Zasmidium cellare TaxID=395010 RepID=A0ABR0E926_ZASCE|nr:hypothetical protein PRZ48_010577 [Zasmidium cellare]
MRTHTFLFIATFSGCLGLVRAQSSTGAGYVGYNLTLEGDQDSVVYSTDDTRPNASVTEPNPDVFLNASVNVGEIDIQVDNLTAKINLDLEILNLLSFNAGVNLEIDAVRLLIQDVKAKVLLEARLEKLVEMVNDTLNSIDLNPIIATLGEGVGDVVGSVGDPLSSESPSSSAEKRSFELEQNILFSINDYAGNTHTNRVLAQNGDLVDKSLDNDGNLQGERTIGTYLTEMTPVGERSVVDRNGEVVTEQEYRYEPYRGLAVISVVYTNEAEEVVGTQVLVESSAGGSSTISEDL